MSEIFADKEAILAALRRVRDPELDRSITDLNMVREVTVHDGSVHVDLALTVKGCPLRGKIRDSVREAVMAIPGVKEVTVELGVMTDEERHALVRKHQGDKEAKSQILDLGSKTQIIAVSSGKGGVGKSTVTANLSVALAQSGFQVGVMDADIYGFSMPRMLGVEGQPTVFNKAIVPLKAYDMQVMSMGFLVEENTPVVWRGPMLTGAINQFLRDVLWADLDYLVIDLPPGTGDVALSIINRLPKSKIVLVTTPQQAAAHVASRAGHLARKVNQEILGIIENMSYFVCPDCGAEVDVFGSGGAEILSRELGVPVLGKVPLETGVRLGGDEGRPVVYHAPESPAGKAFREIAESVIESTQPSRRVGSS